MRALTVCSMLAVAGALALGSAHASSRPAVAAPRASAGALALLPSVSACSAAGGCVQGCALAVAERAGRARSPTTPCASQAITACTEEVAAPPAAVGARSSCGAQLRVEREAQPNLGHLPRALRELMPQLRSLTPQLQREAEKTLRALRAQRGRARGR